MGASTVEDITIEYEEDGVMLIKQLDKAILSKGAWTTILFRYQDWVRSNEAYGPTKYAIRRYQKRNNEYQLRSKFTISSVDQGTQLISILGKWIAAESAATIVTESEGE